MNLQYSTPQKVDRMWTKTTHFQVSFWNILCRFCEKSHNFAKGWNSEVGESGVSAVRYPKRDVFLRYVKNEGGFYIYAILDIYKD